MKKYKEFRCVVEMSIFTIIMVALSFFLGIQHSYGYMVMGFIIAAACMFAISMSYNNILSEDTLTYYKWYGIMMWTKEIAYHEISRVEVKGKHKVTITPKSAKEKKINIYVFDPEGFTADLKRLKNMKRSEKRHGKHKK